MNFDMKSKFKKLVGLFQLLFILQFIIGTSACSQEVKEKQAVSTSTINLNKMFNNLNPDEKSVLLFKSTEYPGTGKYEKFDGKGTYLCKQCNAPLYRSADKFDAHCGWPSFDDEIPGAIKRIPDADGQRTEIVCANCGAHLGHIFNGEHFTSKNTRHCVNSISLNFIPVVMNQQESLQRAIYAGGCFWGTEYYLQKAKGVVSATVGYIGGHTANPTYEQVCSHTTGYAEAVEVYFDPTKTSYEELTKLFFEIHDPTQVDRQGPDVGDQYRSEIFYCNDAQKQIAQKLIDELTAKGYKVATKLEPAGEFYTAESYHQNYYQKKGGTPYCHIKVSRF
jgi:peptide methionine sulfoxide reductase msrA/msrB